MRNGGGFGLLWVLGDGVVSDFSRNVGGGEGKRSVLVHFEFISLFLQESVGQEEGVGGDMNVCLLLRSCCLVVCFDLSKYLARWKKSDR